MKKISLFLPLIIFLFLIIIGYTGATHLINHQKKQNNFDNLFCAVNEDCSSVCIKKSPIYEDIISIFYYKEGKYYGILKEKDLTTYSWTDDKLTTYRYLSNHPHGTYIKLENNNDPFFLQMQEIKKDKDLFLKQITNNGFQCFKTTNQLEDSVFEIPQNIDFLEKNN